MRISCVLLPLLLVCSSVAVAADQAPPIECGIAMTARFYEGAPRDRFKFTNLSEAAWQIKSVALDLNGSAGKLIFDTQDGGTGVEVFQPYKTEQGEELLFKMDAPSDGAQQISLAFREFKTTESFVFSIDVDDQLSNSELGQIRVSGGELHGSKLTVEFEHTNGSVETLYTEFAANNQAKINPGNCQ